MSLKPNTSRLLLFLTIDTWMEMNSQTLEMLLPDLTKSGIRSLLTYCQNMSWIKIDVLDGKKRVYLTNYGKKELELQFPVFSLKVDQWQGEWELVMFLTPPKTDPQFRFLRNYLLARQGCAISRGNYLIPSYMAGQLVEDVYQSYRKSVMIFSIKKWVFGDEKTYLSDHYHLSDLADSYSGASNEINELLNKKNEGSFANDQQKKSFFSVFNRLVSTIQKDSGMLHYYFPEVKGGLNLLSSLKLLL